VLDPFGPPVCVGHRPTYSGLLRIRGKQTMDIDPDPDPDPDPESPVVPDPSDPTVVGCGLSELVRAANNGDSSAWNALVSRYTPLVESVTRRYRLSLSDAEDVSQVVWLRLFENRRRLREPRALPGWIRTTTKNEALRLLALGRRAEGVQSQRIPLCW